VRRSAGLRRDRHPRRPGGGDTGALAGLGEHAACRSATAEDLRRRPSPPARHVPERGGAGSDGMSAGAGRHSSPNGQWSTASGTASITESTCAGVQQIISAQVSGILFTADPTRATGRSSPWKPPSASARLSSRAS
jgi:hypothetical protein